MKQTYEEHMKDHIMPEDEPKPEQIVVKEPVKRKAKKNG